MKYYAATVHLLVKVENLGQACDAISGLLSEGGLYQDNSCLEDWSYVKRDGNEHSIAHEVKVPIPYDRDEEDLDTIVVDSIAERARLNTFCANCLQEYPIDDLNPIKDIFERVAPGETMPAGECPACGCLAHMKE